MVGVEATFPDVATAASLVNAANSGGGKVQIHGATAVLVPSGTRFTLSFDLPMLVASYPVWMNTLIKVFDAANVATGPISHVAAADTATSVTFTGPVLAFDATYSVYIASDVLSATGTQLWNNATYTFHTQKAQSTPLPNEIQGLSAYYDAGHTILATNGFEINATNTLYFRMTSTDPASNTIDLASLSYMLDGTFVASFTLTQPAASSPFLDGSYSITGLTPGNHTLTFQSASTTALLSFPVGFPAWSSQAPPNGSTSVTIDTRIVITFTEAVATASIKQQNIVLSHGGTLSSYTLAIASNVVTIDPDDGPDNGLIPFTTYQVEVGPLITDLIGNPNVSAATTTTTFTTQAYQTPPGAITGIALFKDASRTLSFAASEGVGATQTVYIRVTGSDGATQTQDVTTATVILPVGGPVILSLLETASDSGGIFEGQYTLTGLYGFPGPTPPAVNPNVSWKTVAVPAATLTVPFPNLDPAQTKGNTSGGPVALSGATGILLDSPLSIGFSPAISSQSVTSAMIDLTLGGVSVAANYSVNAAGDILTLTPTSPLLPESTYVASAPFSLVGLHNALGNPLFSSFSFSFTTQASQTPPVSIANVSLYPNSGYAPLQVLPTDSDFLNNGTLYIEMGGVDASPQTQDTTIASLSDGRLIKLTETASATGVFRGSAVLGGLADGQRLTVQSNVTPAKINSILVSYPKLSVVSPASGAANVPISANIVIQADEDLDPTTVVATNVRLLIGGAPVAGSVTYAAAPKQITFTLTALLNTNALCRVQVNGVKDNAGNTLQATFSYTFTTQLAAIPPTLITSLKVYSDSAYSSLLANNAGVVPLQTIYVHVAAVDASAGTQDYTPVRLKSVTTGSTFVVNLVETGLNTGIFRGSLTLFPEDNQTLVISSEEDATFFQNLIIPVLPKVTSMTPASGTIDIALNTTFKLFTDSPVSAASLSSATVRLADTYGLLSPVLSLVGPNEIDITAPMGIGRDIFLEVKNSLKDTGGLGFVPFIATFKTLGNSFSNPTFYADAAYTQVIPGGANFDPMDTLWVEILGPDFQSGVIESIIGNFTDTLTTALFTLTEDAPGRYRGSFTVPDSPGKTLTVTMATLPSVSGNLTISPLFGVASVIPANGAVWVSADMWPTWTFTRPVDPTRVTADRFVVKEISTGNLLPGTLTRSADGMQVVFRPTAFFSLLTEIELTVAGDVADTKGKTLPGPMITRFTVQGPPSPPSVIFTLQNFNTSAYTVISSSVTNEGTMYLQVTAQDSSPNVIGVTWVRIDSSDSRMRGVDVMLVETGRNTGIYRGSATVKAFDGATVTVVSRADPAFALSLTVQQRPTVVSIVPASGSSNIALDQVFLISFSRPMKTSAMTDGFNVKTRAGDVVGFNVSLSGDGKTVSLSPQSVWTKGVAHFVTIGEPFSDQADVGVAPTTFGFTTRGDVPSKIDLFSGLAPRTFQAASRVGEVLPGEVTVLATTSNLFDRLPETRTAEIMVGNTVMNVVLSEIATLPGLFAGLAVIPDERGTAGRATLQFGTKPAISFQVAPYPVLKDLFPASGAINVGEEDPIIATFNKAMAPEAASGALRLSAAGVAIPYAFVSPGTAPVALAWKTISGLGIGATHSVELRGLIDLLGQPAEIFPYQFLAKGYQGINVYEDNQFARAILGEILTVPEIFTELVLLAPPKNSAERVYLKALGQRNATSPQFLILHPSVLASRRYRGDLKFDSSRNIPRYTVPLVPGERLELSSPNLPYARRVLYYLTKEGLSPTSILGITLYREKYFAQKVEGDLHLATVYVEVEAKDANWMTVDTTRVKVFSDSDTKGFEVTLTEPERHADRFRGIFSLDLNGTNIALAKLKARPGDRITIVSVTDPQVLYSARWAPENRIEHVRVWPSPVRGNRVTISFYLNFPANVEFYIYDASGEELRGVDYRGIEGENRIPWELPGRLANGVYFFTLELTSEDGFTTIHQKFKGKFAILR